MGGFLDAWPARDNDSGTNDAYHPLSRASRREMQQTVLALPLQLGKGSGISRAQLHGYCMGLKSREDFQSGYIVGHSGGYPGFGSKMDWHPLAGVGVIGLANGRYGGPYGTTMDAVAALVQHSALGRRKLQPHSAVAGIRKQIDQALVCGEFDALKSLLSENVGMDEPLSKRAATVAGLAKIHGALTPEEELMVRTPTQVSWWLSGDRGRVGVSITLNPQVL